MSRNFIVNRRERMERREIRLRQMGRWVDPPDGMLSESDEDTNMWLDACSVDRAQSLIDTWREHQRAKTAEETRERGERARHDLYA